MSGAVSLGGSRRASGASFRVFPDGRLAQLAARGSEAAFSEIFRRYHQSLYRYANSILGNDEDARDAVQTSMVKLLDSLPGERRRIELKPWLFRITHNEAISIIRRRRESGLDSVPEPTLATDDADLRLRAKTLVADLVELPDKQRSAVVMRELCGLSFKEIGGALNSNPAAAKQAVHEGRRALQQLEAGREMDCDSARASISARDRRLLKGRQIRAHLKTCAPCRDFELGIRSRREGLSAIAPLPLGAAHEMLQQILGSGAGPAGGLGTLGAIAAAKAMGGGGAAQVAATAVVASGAGVGVATQVSNASGEREPAQATAKGMTLDSEGVAGAGGLTAQAVAQALGEVREKLGSVRADEGDGDASKQAGGPRGGNAPAGAGPPTNPGGGASTPAGPGKGAGKPPPNPGGPPHNPGSGPPPNAGKGNAPSSPPGQPNGPGKPTHTPGGGPTQNPAPSPPGPPKPPKVDAPKPEVPKPPKVEAPKLDPKTAEPPKAPKSGPPSSPPG